MKWILDPHLTLSPEQISYNDRILFMGSCFSSEIAVIMKEMKFNIIQNPNGILYDPLSLGKNLISYIGQKHYELTDLFQLNGLWHSWQHHSSFSALNPVEVINKINKSQSEAHQFVKSLDWLVISPGSAFHYVLTKSDQAVANCHKAPSSLFHKKLMEIPDIVEELGKAISELSLLSPHLRVILTVSPVRHIRDGIVDNNRSKARLLEAVHAITSQFSNVYYFPAYELLIDVLRDYRFYADDLIHPANNAIRYIFEQFQATFIKPDTLAVMGKAADILKAVKHTPFHPSTEGYKDFKINQLQKIKEFQQAFPASDWSNEIRHFTA